MKPRKDLARSIAHISRKLLPLIPCLYLMQSREGQFDSSVTRPQRATTSRFLTGVRLVTAHSSTDIQTEFLQTDLLIPPLTEPTRCTRGTSSSLPKAVVLHTTSHSSSGCLCLRMNCLVMYLLSLRLLVYSSPASINFP
nr:unnamed protein product [Callosobruchus chinensis]